MRELREVIEACRAARASDRPAVLATVVRVQGSAYRRPGARMVFTADGAAAGLVSGGCLEADLALRADEVLRSGRSHTVVYDMRSPDDIVWGLGLGCDGEVRVLLERQDPDSPSDWIANLAECRAGRRATAMATLFAVDGDLAASVGDRVWTDGAARSATFPECRLVSELNRDVDAALERKTGFVGEYRLPEGRAEALVEFFAPPPSLLVFGAGTDARPLVRLAYELGWEPTVVDQRSGLLTASRFPDASALLDVEMQPRSLAALTIDERTPVVVMTHHFLHDLEILRQVLPSRAPYVGLIGPRRRRELLLRELRRSGCVPSVAQLARLYAPVGLDVGSDSPAEIALAILAEAQAVLAGRRGGFLRERRAPLHEDSA